MPNEGWLSSLFVSRGNRRFELVVLEGEQAGQRFPLRNDRMLIGRRAPDPDQPKEICLSDRSVSVRQAILEIKRGRVFIEHLSGATNPTVVNRRRVTRTKLRRGDIIVLGLVVLELREVAEGARSEPGVAAADPATGRAATGEPTPERHPRAAEAVPRAEAKTWLERPPPAEADEAATTAWVPPQPAATREPEDPGEIAAGLDADDLPEDERATIVRPRPETATPVPGHQDETIIAESTDAEPKP